MQLVPCHVRLLAYATNPQFFKALPTALIQPKLGFLRSLQRQILSVIAQPNTNKSSTWNQLQSFRPSQVSGLTEYSVCAVLCVCVCVSAPNLRRLVPFKCQYYVVKNYQAL